ncbi:MAG: 2,3-bisphosphoglycerate-independent phosphoglycerate mutase [Candidatus Diapherotrites archaeon]|nr:2,3-bisphosphoglycerate-independent phosphoglycerate mutase [Candidatus Diapherotrites archaeon]
MEHAEISRKVVLIVLDGWGIGKKGDPGNCVEQANIPNFTKYWNGFPHCENDASGEAVGLPAGSQGNSEVGHLHMGAGRIVWQPFEMINRKIRSEEFFKNPALKKAMENARKKNSKLHLMGLCSDEGVHAHVNHLLALLEMAKREKVPGEKVFVHFFSDGRDVPEKSAEKYAKAIEEKCAQLGFGEIASVCGRYYSMDRDNNWDRTQKAFELLTEGRGKTAKSALQAIRNAYADNVKTDYYIEPTAIVAGNGKPKAVVGDNDSIIFFNFRTDRVRQLTKAFVSGNFDLFERKKAPKVFFACFGSSDKSVKVDTAFSETHVKNCLGEVLAKKGLKQLRMAETEKYAHVTYFFNAQVEAPFKGEERLLVPSAKVPSYDLKPEMSAAEIAENASGEIAKKEFAFVLINFANGDLVGHSAVIPAVVKGIEAMDKALGVVVETCLANGYTAIITADHGSAEEKLYPDGTPKPSHSTNRVPFIAVSNDKSLAGAKFLSGGQKDVAPTVLEIMGLPKPAEMTGRSLLRKI